MNKYKRYVISVVSIILITITVIGCTKKEEKSTPITRTELFMGTVVKVTLYDSKDEKILDSAFNRVKEIEDLVSINKNDTELDKVNDNSGIEPVKVSEDTYKIVKRGLEYSIMSNGSFDVAIGPLVKLWSIGLPEAKVPTTEEITKAISLVDYNKVKLDDSDKSIFLEEKGMVIDLGSIAKGYAADEIGEVLKEMGCNSAIIDLGGNIYALGTKVSGEPWRIGIQDPLSKRGESIGVVKIVNQSVVTSGVYERYLEKDGVKYHHILNPETGYPYDTDIAGVSIITENSMDADALSTTVFSKGIKGGIEFVENIEGVEAIFITTDNEVYLTSGIKENFEITNSKFKIKE